MRKWKKTALAAIVGLLCLSVPAVGLADAGDFGGSFDYGGGWDSSAWDDGAWNNDAWDDNTWDNDAYGQDETRGEDARQESYAAPILGLPDAGDFGGSSDYGGSDWGGSSSWDYDSDWGGGNSLDGFGGGLTLVVAVIFAVIIIVIIKKGPKGSSSSGRPAGGLVTPASQLMPIAQLVQADPFFAEAAMREKIANLYVQMQNAWQDKQWEPMRAHMTDALFSQFARQLDTYIRDGKTNRVERIAVLSVVLRGFMSDSTNDTIVAQVKTRIVDYVVDDKTGQVVRGSNTAEKFMEYEWTLIRAKGVLTPEPGKDGQAVTTNCRNCGAPIDVNHSARCPFCDSVITRTDYDWVISSIKGISQRTGG